VICGRLPQGSQSQDTPIAGVMETASPARSMCSPARSDLLFNNPGSGDYGQNNPSFMGAMTRRDGVSLNTLRYLIAPKADLEVPVRWFTNAAWHKMQSIRLHDSHKIARGRDRERIHSRYSEVFT